MLSKRIIVHEFGVAALLVSLSLAGDVRAQSQVFDHRAFFTFSGPVRLPSTVLPAGKYLFRLPDSATADQVVEVLSPNGKTLYGLFMTVPIRRLKGAQSTPQIQFIETHSDAPPAIRAYWMPDEVTGREFIYPRQQAIKLAKDS